MTHLTLLPGGLDTTWHTEALCRNMPGDIFFPGKDDYRLIKEAQRICNRCPVRRECLEYALDRPEKFGIWGGETGRSRERMLRQRRTVGGAA